MTVTTQSNAADSRSQIDVLEGLDIAQLRKAAKTLGVNAQRDWTKEDFVDAIKIKQAEKSSVGFVFDTDQGPKPGYARVLIHRDNTPNHKNSPVHIGLNGQLYQVPRGVEVDVPIPFIEILKNARVKEMQKQVGSQNSNLPEEYKEQEHTSYPFQVIAMTPGTWKNSHDNRSYRHAPKKEFHSKFGSWPTDGELKEYVKNKINKAS
jgi:hypothetical protein